VAPWYPGASSRLPTPTQHPSVAERTPGVCSVRTRTPPGSTVRRTTAAPDCPATVVVEGETPGGEAVRIEADGMLARCLQHEIDHLDGVLFIDRLSPLKRNMVLKKYRKQLS